MANFEFLLALDNSLRSGLGEGIFSLLSKSPPQSLQAGERRYFTVVKGARRSCVQAWGGSTRLGTPTFTVGGKRAHPALHMCSDIGSIDWPGAHWLLHKANLRGAWAFDFLHRRVCDVEEAQSSSGVL